MASSIPNKTLNVRSAPATFKSVGFILLMNVQKAAVITVGVIWMLRRLRCLIWQLFRKTGNWKETHRLSYRMCRRSVFSPLMHLFTCRFRLWGVLKSSHVTNLSVMRLFAFLWMCLQLTDGGKADRARMSIGDIILTINGISTDSMNHLEAQNKIKACTDHLSLTLQR